MLAPLPSLNPARARPQPHHHHHPAIPTPPPSRIAPQQQKQREKIADPAAAMQRLSLGSPAGRPSRLSAAAEEEAGPADEKAAKAVARGPAAPDRSIHLVPVLTLLCFLVLFLLSHDPAAVALTDSPVLAAVATVTARSLDAGAGVGGADATTASSGVYRRLKEDPRRQQQQQ